MTTSAKGTPRKPAASSNSTGHSPLGSPTAHGQRNLIPAATMLAVGMSNSGLKSLNNGWPVWTNGSSHPSSKRTASLSSATSMTETGNDNFRSSVGEAWSSSLSPAPWDMTTGSPAGPVEIGGSPRKEYIQMDAHSPNHPYSLQQVRQRQATAAQAAAFSGSRIVSLEEEKRLLDDAERQPKSSFSPQRFDNAAAKTSPFAVQPTGLPIHANSMPTYDHTSAHYQGDELSYALGNLSIQDHEQPYGTAHTPYRPQQPVHSVPPMHGMPMPQIQPMAPMQPPLPRTGYSIYAQNEYQNYYPPLPLASREPFQPVDYPYGYDSYRNTPDPTPIYIPSAPPPAQPAPGMYGAARPSGFYPPQTILYPSPPLHNHLSTPQLNAMPNIQDKDPYTTIPQGLILTSMRHSTPSPHPYPPPTGQLPVIMGVGASVYGHAPHSTHPMHIYPGLRPNRRLDQVDPSATSRSPLLHEFRTDKARKWELREILGHIVEFSGDQHGSRFIQQKLEIATPEEKQAIFAEIVPSHALQLIQDVFGNYVIQKLLEYGTPRQKLQLVSAMEGHILTLSLQMYGCRVVQKAVEQVPPEQQITFVKELETYVLRCVKDANGNHVIQKLIERVASDLLGFISAFRGHVFELASHPYGCRVLQRCFEHLNEEQTRPLLEELHKFGSNLMQDQFGNYVIQFVLEHGRPEDRLIIISKLRGHFLLMAKHKFASNVCEKALTEADPETRRVLIEEILTPKSDGVSPIMIMMKDQFANYVLQRCLTVVEGDQKIMLAEMVKAQLVSMQRYANTYSKHLASIERLLEKSLPSKTEGTTEEQENA